MSLRLDKLPDRTQARLTISVTPELASALQDYAHIYQQTYGLAEKPETLIPAMIEKFLADDAGFRRARKALHTEASKGET
jgi:hypothetical protein